MIELRLKDSNFKRMRFAVSPCFELVMAFRSVLRNSPTGYFSGWVAGAKERIDASDFPCLTALVRKKGYIPDFLTPPPVNTNPIITDEINRVLKTPKSIVIRDIEKIQGLYGLEESVYIKFRNTYKYGLKLVTEEMIRFWQKALMPYWGKCKKFLESDILYRAKNIAVSGIETVFDNMGKGIEYSNGVLKIDKKYLMSFELNNQGLVLMPSVFSYPDVYVICDERLPVTVIYPIKEVHLFSTLKLTPAHSLQLLAGSTSAIILQLLDLPHTTLELSILARLTPGAVSQQLGKLYQTDLVNRFRDGKQVYYVLSGKGRELLKLLVTH